MFNDPVIYMSRATTVYLWKIVYGFEPNTTMDLFMGDKDLEVLFDDRMDFGVMRLEENPDGR